MAITSGPAIHATGWSIDCASEAAGAPGLNVSESGILLRFAGSVHPCDLGGAQGTAEYSEFIEPAMQMAIRIPSQVPVRPE